MPNLSIVLAGLFALLVAVWKAVSAIRSDAAQDVVNDANLQDATRADTVRQDAQTAKEKAHAEIEPMLDDDLDSELQRLRDATRNR